jgi:hypothetical protein
MNLVFMILGMIGLNNYSVKDDLSKEDRRFVKTVINHLLLLERIKVK